MIVMFICLFGPMLWFALVLWAALVYGEHEPIGAAVAGGTTREVRRSASQGVTSRGPADGAPAEPPRELTREEFDEMFPAEDES